MGDGDPRLDQPPDLRRREPLTLTGVLGWADAHRAATGDWPRSSSGVVRHAPFEVSWNTIDKALRQGLRGLPSGRTLAQVLLEERGVVRHASAAGRRPLGQSQRQLQHERRLHAWSETLSVEKILAWADAHRIATGRWPRTDSGPIRGVAGETWSAISTALNRGTRGLPGGTTLRGLLAEHHRRGVRRHHRNPLTVDQILAWADAHHAARGRWPVARPLAVAEAPGELWSLIDVALRNGCRGLPGGSSLPLLLAEHRGVPNRSYGVPLSIEQILAWADDHRAATGRWPSVGSGPIHGTAGATWNAVNAALRLGGRGLPGGSSLPRLLAEHRGKPPGRRSPC